MKKVGILFPGYGSQSVGMGKELYDESRIVQEFFEEAAQCLNANFVKLCFASSDTELAKLTNAYPAIFLISSSIFALLKEQDIELQVVGGYDSGQYAALFAAGGMSFPDGLYLLSKYAQFYHEFLQTADFRCITVSGLDTDLVQRICLEASTGDAQATIAVYTTDRECIVSGLYDAVDRVRTLIEDTYPDGKVVHADTGIGLHSTLLSPVAEQFKIYLWKVDFKELVVPLISNITGLPLIQKEDIINELIDRITQPIRLDKIITHFPECDRYIQVGPGDYLARLFKQTYPDRPVLAVNKPADIRVLHEAIDDAKIDDISPAEK